MGKGFAWVNGIGIGRFWNITASGSCSDCTVDSQYYESKCLKGCGEPCQRLYHVPREWLSSTNANVLVAFSDVGGDPREIKLIEIHS